MQRIFLIKQMLFPFLLALSFLVIPIGGWASDASHRQELERMRLELEK